jgi:hypothetical protein
MRCFRRPPVAEDYLTTLKALAANGPAALVFHGAALSAAPELTAWLAAQREFWLVPVPADIGLVPGGSVSAGAKSAVSKRCASHSPDSNSKQVKR